MKQILYLFLLLVCFAANAQQAYTITGIVTDDKDAPIPGATVFIADSRKVTATDNGGRFSLPQVQPGNYNIVVKMIGYEVLQHSFMLQDKNARFRFKLQEDNVMLNTVNITSMSLAERKRWLAIFMECFLGKSKNAAQCKVLNTDDIKLRFDKKTNVLRANSSEFLIIENRALGYRLKYLLNNFLYDRSSVGKSLISFDGNLFFEEIAGNPRQQKKWEEERVNTYFGSVPHYYRSLFSNTLSENGFVTYLFPNPKALANRAKNNPMELAKCFTPLGVTTLNKYIKDVDNNFKTFDLGRLRTDSMELYVFYTAKDEPRDFVERGNVLQRPMKKQPGQFSIVRPTQDTLLVSRNGDISPVASVLLEGFWSWGQVASFLPSDYTFPLGTKLPKPRKIVENNALKSFN